MVESIYVNVIWKERRESGSGVDLDQEFLVRVRELQ